MTVFGPRREFLRPVAILLGLLALYVVAYRHDGARRSAPSEAFREPQVEPVVAAPRADLGGAGALETGAARAVIAQTARLRIYTSSGSYDPAAVKSMAQPLQEALEYVEQQTGMELARPVNIVFDRRPEACGLDAIAYTEVRTLILYACPETPTRRAVNILAHEFVHQLAHDRYGATHLKADLLLSEGVATWGAGRYWLGGERSFRDFVATNYGDNLLPLAADPRDGASIDTMNQLYYQWASYIEWLRETEDPAAFDKLYSGETGRSPGSAPYQQILGLSFAETEARWQAWIEQTAD